MLKSIKIEQLTELVENSYQDKIARLNEQVAEKLGQNVSLFSVFDDHIFTISEDGNVSKYRIDGNGIGECIEFNIEYLDDIDESIELNESAKRLIENLIVGNMELFRNGIKDIFDTVKTEHIESSKNVDERLSTIIKQSSLWHNVFAEQTSAIRKALYGSLKNIKERELHPRLNQFSEIKESDQSRNDILIAINRIAMRLQEDKEILDRINTDRVSESSFLSIKDANDFHNSIATDVSDIKKLIDQKIKLDSSIAPIQSLYDLHDSVVDRVNEMDLCVRFIDKIFE